MKYAITRLVLGEKVSIELSAEEFADAKRSKSCLFQALFIEEKFNYILENYCEFEKELLNAAIDNMLFFDFNWSKGANDVHTINRRVVNLVSSCRLYLDHVVHNLNIVYGKNSLQASEIEKKKREEYDANLGYGVLEAIRNYTQHRGFSVHSITRHSTRVEERKDSSVKHAVTPWITVASLAADKKFKPSVLEELTAIGEKVDIKPLIRQYLESIGRIHLTIRELLKNDMATWESMLQKLVERFRDVGGDNTAGLAVVAFDDSGKHVEHIDIFDDFLERRRWLELKNHFLTHYASSFVTSEVYTA